MRHRGAAGGVAVKAQHAANLRRAEWLEYHARDYRMAAKGYVEAARKAARNARDFRECAENFEREAASLREAAK